MPPLCILLEIEWTFPLMFKNNRLGYHMFLEIFNCAISWKAYQYMPLFTLISDLLPFPNKHLTCSMQVTTGKKEETEEEQNGGEVRLPWS